MRLASVDDLRTVFRSPARIVEDKAIDHLDEHCTGFLALSPFAVVSTADASGTCDASPRGGAPGFARALDPHTLAWADLSGNHRLDSFQNLVHNDAIALLFMIPGMDETLRVNGTAELRTDPELCEAFAVDGRTPRVVVVVTVVEAYLHCAKALRRAGLWSPDSWTAPEDRPSAACILRDHARIEVDAALVASALEDDATATLWRPGGDDVAG